VIWYIIFNVCIYFNKIVFI